MNKSDKTMEEIFDVIPVEETTLPIIKELPPKKDSKPGLEEDLDDAYQQSKENLQDIIEHGKEAMEEILRIAKEGQHPRAFEVFGTILKNMVEANDKLLDIQKKIREVDSRTEKNTTNIDKAIFVGSTADLSKMLKNKE